MSKMDVFVWFASGRRSTLDCSTIQENTDHRDITLEIACVNICLGQLVRCNSGIPLGGGEAAMSKPLL